MIYRVVRFRYATITSVVLTSPNLGARANVYHITPATNYTYVQILHTFNSFGKPLMIVKKSLQLHTTIFYVDIGLETR